MCGVLSPSGTRLAPTEAARRPVACCLMPLTIVMKEILIQNKIDMTQIGNASNLAKLQGMSELLKYSTIVVASVPVMLLYPLVQKHLVKGVMIGAVKG